MGELVCQVADVPVKVVKVPPAPTAVTITGEKDLLNTGFLHVQPAVGIFKLRSIKPPPRAIAGYSLDRTKVLQTATFKTVRAMRSVSCDAY